MNLFTRAWRELMRWYCRRRDHDYHDLWTLIFDDYGNFNRRALVRACRRCSWQMEFPPYTYVPPKRREDAALED